MAVLADLGDGGEANFNDSRNKFFFGRIKVRHCCCVLARCLGKETKCSLLVMAYFALFNNVFETLNLLLIIYQNTKVLARVLPWLANGDHVMYSTNKCFTPAAFVDSSLQLSISAETIHTASHFKLLLEYKTRFPSPILHL